SPFRSRLPNGFSCGRVRWKPSFSGRTQNCMAIDIKNLDEVSAFTTKDGSEIRELLAHRNSCIRNQSLAEARIQAGASTTPHYHPRTEEIYYILSGAGLM